MRDPVEVRLLGRADGATLRAMLAMFGTAFEDVATYTARQPDDTYLEALLARDTFVAIAASSPRSAWTKTTQTPRSAASRCTASISAVATPRLRCVRATARS